jgi:hypothetical protein
MGTIVVANSMGIRTYRCYVSLLDTQDRALRLC